MTTEQSTSHPGSPTDPTAGVTSVPFTYRSVAYTVDLDPADAAAFDAALAPYIAAGRRVGGRRSAGPSGP